MAGRTWEEEYERQQSRLRDGPPRCEHRSPDGNRCLQPGRYKYVGYFPALAEGILCDEHRAEKDNQTATPSGKREE